MRYKILTAILIFLITSMAIMLYFSFKKEFRIYEPDCILEKINDTCQPKEISVMFFKNQTFGENNLSIEFLNSNCKILNEKTWGCNKYLIKNV